MARRKDGAVRRGGRMGALGRVGVVLLLAGLAAVDSSARADDATKADLKQGGVPEWALDCAADLIKFRRDPIERPGVEATAGGQFGTEEVTTVDFGATGAGFAPGSVYRVDAEWVEVVGASDGKVTFRRGVGGTKIVAHEAGRSIDGVVPLASLDAEADMLAAALLRLEEPDGVIALYGHWYGANASRTRTPASALIWAQAYSLRARHLFDPPPGRTQLGKVVGNVQRFSAANESLARGIQILNAALGDLNPNAESPGEELALWIQQGLPKPLRAEEVDDPKVGRVRLPADEAIAYVREYLAWQARLRRELGDVIFRQTGDAVGRPRTPGEQKTALAYYADAREPLYLARLIAVDSPALAAEASALSDRIAWARSGLGFGGADFYRFEVFRPDRYISASLKGLRASVDKLKNLMQEDAKVAGAQSAWLVQMQDNRVNRAALDEAFRSQALRGLNDSVLAIKGQLHDLRSEQTRRLLERAQAELGTALGKGQLRTLQQTLTTGLVLNRGQYLQEFLAMAQDLERHGLLLEGPGEVGFGLGDADRKRLNSDFDRVGRFVTHLGAADYPEIGQGIRGSWDRLGDRRRPGTERGTTLLILTAESNAADLDVKGCLAAIHIDDLRADVGRLKAIRDDLNDRLVEQKTKLDGLWDDFKRAKEGAEKEAADKALRAVIVPGLKADADRLKGRVREAIDRVRDVQEKLAQFRKIVQDVKEAKKRVEEAYEQIVGVVKSAKAIPVTITAGMTTGTSIDIGDAIAKGAEAVLQKIVDLYEGKVTAADFQAKLDEYSGDVDMYLSAAQEFEEKWDAKKFELNKAETMAKAMAAYRKGDIGDKGGEVWEQYKSLEKELNDAISKELKPKLSQAQGDVERAENAIAEARRKELENELQKAVERSKAALGRLDRARTESVHRLALLAAQAERIDRLDDERRKAADLEQTVTNVISAKEGAVPRPTEPVTEEEKRLDDELRRRLAALLAQIEELSRPRSRMVTADLVASLAPALTLAEGRPKPQATVDVLDRGNAELLRCARWLFVLTGDRSCVALGSACLSADDLAHSLSEVERRFEGAVGSPDPQGLADRFLLIPPFLYELDLDRAAIDRLVGARPDATSCLVRVAFQGDAAEKPEPRPIDPEQVDGPMIPAYSGRQAASGVIDYRLQLHEEQFGILIGFWTLVQFRDKQRDPATYPVLSPIGPFRRQVPGVGSVVLPIRVPNTGETFDAKIWNPLYEARSISDFMRTSRTDGWVTNFIKDPFPERAAHAPNYQVLGRGIEGLWSFSLEGNGVSIPKKKLKDVESVRFVFCYLACQPQKLVGLDRRPPTPDLSFLRATRTRGEPGEVGPSFFGPSWENSPAARGGRLDALARQLDAIEGPPPAGAPAGVTPARPDADLREVDLAVDAELVALFRGASNPSADGPPAVAAQVRKARNLLDLIVVALERDFVDPLEESARVLRDVETRAQQLAVFTELIRRQNEKYEKLAEYVDRLDGLIKALRSVGLTDDESKKLNGLKGRPWRRRLVDRVARQLRVSPGEKAEIIAYVLKRLIDDREGYRPPSAEKESSAGGPPKSEP